MIRHQMWNQRRQNSWIFLELLIGGFFLWMVVDPICIITADRAIPSGYNSQGTYVLKLGNYDSSFAEYDETQNTDSLLDLHYRQILRTIRTCPEVESFTIGAFGSFPNSPSWSGDQYYNDSIRLNAQTYYFVQTEGSDMGKTYGFTDVNTGKQLQFPVDFSQREMIALSACAAKRLFGTTDVVGKKVLGHNREKVWEIVAVFQDIKHFDVEQPYPLSIQSMKLEVSPYMASVQNIVFRLKKGVDDEDFRERFEREVAPHIRKGNFYYNGLSTFDEYAYEKAVSSGVINRLRLHYSLAGFAILCIFLGMLGTFWIRSNARREEIGLMRSMGASQDCIVRQFLIEAWMLTTISFLLSLWGVVNYIYIEGFAEPTKLLLLDDYHPDPAYWQNRTLPHFMAVTLITYVLLLLVALVGTYIPVRRASRTLPADALRDE